MTRKAGVYYGYVDDREESRKKERLQKAEKGKAFVYLRTDLLVWWRDFFLCTPLISNYQSTTQAHFPLPFPLTIQVF
jgi:hypothetical protein